MERIIEETFNVPDKEIPRVVKKLNRDYGPNINVHPLKQGIKVKGKVIGDWIFHERTQGIIAKDRNRQYFSDVFFVPSDFDQAIKRAVDKHFGRKYKVIRAKIPPTKFARGVWTWSRRDKLFIYGDFKTYDEVVKLLGVVEQVINKVIAANTEIRILYRHGKSGIGEYLKRRVARDIKAKIECQEKVTGRQSDDR